MALRKEAIFQNDLGRFYKLNIYDSDFSGTATEFTVSSRGFDLEYQCKDRTRFTGVIPSFVTFDIVPRSTADETFIEDIRNATYKRFQIEILESLSVGSGYENWWCGNILSDVSSEQNLSFEAGTKATLTATDGLAQLEDVKVDDNNTYTLNQLTSFVDYIRQCLLNDVGTSFCWGASDRFLYTMCNWSTDTMPSVAQSVDPLRQSGCIFRAFQEVVQGEAITISSFEMLDRICRAWGARLFLSEGKWRFIQNNVYAQMSSGQFRREYLKGSNTIDGSAVDDLNVSSGGNVLGGGTFDILPPLQKVQIPYDFLHDYNLLVEPVVVWNTFTDSSGAFGTLSDTVYRSSTNFNSVSLGNINAQTDSNLAWNLYFIPNYFGTVAQINSSAPTTQMGFDHMVTNLVARLKLVGDGGTTYYLSLTSSPQGSGKEWTTSSTWIGNMQIYQGTIPQQYSNSAAASNIGNGVASITGFSQDGTFNAVPESGALSLEVLGRFAFTTFSGGVVNYTDVVSTMEVYPDQPTQQGLALGLGTPDGQNQFLRFQVNNSVIQEQLFSATQGSTVSTDILELDKLNLGTGPNAMSNTRVICFSDTGLTNNDNGTTATWQKYDQTTGDGVTGAMTKILCKEILAGRKQGASVFNGALRRDNFHFHKAYSNISGSKIFVPQEIKFNAEKSIWDGQWIECNIDVSGQTYNSADTPNLGIPNSNTNNY